MCNIQLDISWTYKLAILWDSMHSVDSIPHILVSVDIDISYQEKDNIGIWHIRKKRKKSQSNITTYCISRQRVKLWPKKIIRPNFPPSTLISWYVGGPCLLKSLRFFQASFRRKVSTSLIYVAAWLTLTLFDELIFDQPTHIQSNKSQWCD